VSIRRHRNEDDSLWQSSSPREHEKANPFLTCAAFLSRKKDTGITGIVGGARLLYWGEQHCLCSSVDRGASGIAPALSPCSLGRPQQNACLHFRILPKLIPSLENNTVLQAEMGGKNFYFQGSCSG